MVIVVNDDIERDIADKKNDYCLVQAILWSLFKYTVPFVTKEITVYDQNIHLQFTNFKIVLKLCRTLVIVDRAKGINAFPGKRFQVFVSPMFCMEIISVVHSQFSFIDKAIDIVKAIGVWFFLTCRRYFIIRA